MRKKIGVVLGALALAVTGVAGGTVANAVSPHNGGVQSVNARGVTWN